MPLRTRRGTALLQLLRGWGAAAAAVLRRIGPTRPGTEERAVEDLADTSWEELVRRHAPQLLEPEAGDEQAGELRAGPAGAVELGIPPDVEPPYPSPPPDDPVRADPLRWARHDGEPGPWGAVAPAEEPRPRPDPAHREPAGAEPAQPGRVQRDGSVPRQPVPPQPAAPSAMRQGSASRRPARPRPEPEAPQHATPRPPGTDGRAPRPQDAGDPVPSGGDEGRGRAPSRVLVRAGPLAVIWTRRGPARSHDAGSEVANLGTTAARRPESAGPPVDDVAVRPPAKPGRRRRANPDDPVSLQQQPPDVAAGAAAAQARHRTAAGHDAIDWPDVIDWPGVSPRGAGDAAAPRSQPWSGGRPSTAAPHADHGAVEPGGARWTGEEGSRDRDGWDPDRRWPDLLPPAAVEREPVDPARARRLAAEQWGA